MNAPDDFGLSPAATIASVADTTPSPWHTAFWAAWHQRLAALSPALRPDPPADPSDPGVTHHIVSLGGVRIGARLLEARDAAGRPAPPRAGAVILHGYTDVDPLNREEERFTGLARRGIAVLLVRLRGFPGSQLDAGPLDRAPLGYIATGLETLMHGPEDGLRWVVAGAIADAACACQALAEHLAQAGAPGAPIGLRGDSFGGGIAVMAAAQLALAPARRVDIHRLVLGLPSLGDWPWRLSLPDGRVPRAGMNRDLREVMIRNAEREPLLAGLLRACDAVVHARVVRAPTLAKLAFRDDVVPAPTQAAVFNALATPTSLRQRFPVRFGHYDGGLANARRHAQFEAVAEAFLDPAEPCTAPPHPDARGAP
jgi:cephalosporin-C deacetylase-like acetyl esterase